MFFTDAVSCCSLLVKEGRRGKERGERGEGRGKGRGERDREGQSKIRDGTYFGIIRVHESIERSPEIGRNWSPFVYLQRW